MERFIYRSPSHGPIEVRSREPGHDFRCPDDLENALARWANRGEQCEVVAVAPEAFKLLAGCVSAIAAHTGPKRMCNLCRTEILPGGDSLTLNGMFAHVACVEVALSVYQGLYRGVPSTVGRESYAGVAEAVEVAKWIPKITDLGLLAELKRRWPKSLPDLGLATDDQVVAEMNKRGLGLAEMSDATVLEAAKIRGLISGDLAVVDLVRASDAAMQAEIGRRWPGSEAAKMWRELSTERDHLANQVDDLVQQRDAFEDRVHAAAAERDSYKKALAEVDAAIGDHAAGTMAYHRGDWLKAALDELHDLRSKKCQCGCNGLREGPTHLAGSAVALLGCDLGAAVLDECQWFMRCKTCGQLARTQSFVGDQENAESRADSHNEHVHGRLTVRPMLLEPGRIARVGAADLEFKGPAWEPCGSVREKAAQESLRKMMLSCETGPGISPTLETPPSPRKAQVLDEASLADLLAADAKEGA